MVHSAVRTRGHFLSGCPAAKLIDLALMRVQSRWPGRPTDWRLVRNEVAIRCGERSPVGSR